MKKAYALISLFSIIIWLSSCSNPVVFQTKLDNVSLKYNNAIYGSISEDECGYAYDSKKMVFLFSISRGDFSGMDESYNVYRHADDEDIEYLFVIPKPAIRDMVAMSFILKADG